MRSGKRPPRAEQKSPAPAVSIWPAAGLKEVNSCAGLVSVWPLDFRPIHRICKLITAIIKADEGPCVRRVSTSREIHTLSLEPADLMALQPWGQRAFPCHPKEFRAGPFFRSARIPQTDEICAVLNRLLL